MNSISSEWIRLNNIINPWRSRFDDVKMKLDKCVTRREAELVLMEEGYYGRYPLLPDDLKGG